MKAMVGQRSFDLLGVGCGPSNLALAIALEEQQKENGILQTCFFEKQAKYRWHGNTITPQSELQVSFLKDLVTLRNPTSPYSFINFLHQHKRLSDFINLSTFYPSRQEFNQYLSWVAESFSQRIRYGTEVTDVEPIKGPDGIRTLAVHTKHTDGTSSITETRSLVVAAGGTPNIPELFKPYRHDQRIFHHSQYLESLDQVSEHIKGNARIAIVGGGQSAAEAFVDLNDRFPGCHLDLIVRSFAIKPADSSAFVNTIFDPQVIDVMFAKTAGERSDLLSEYRHTNYAAVDEILIEQINNILYQQKVSGIARHQYRSSTEIQEISAGDGGIDLLLHNSATGSVDKQTYDLVILATGYQRNAHRKLLSSLNGYLGKYEVDRRYRVKADPEFQVPIYLQGYCEDSHGLSDTLLSMLAIRSEEIVTDLHRSLSLLKAIN